MICFADFCGYTKNSGNSVQVSSDISCLICLRVSVCSAVIYVALVEDSVQLTFTETPLLSVSVSPEVIHVCVSHSVFSAHYKKRQMTTAYKALSFQINQYLKIL